MIDKSVNIYEYEEILRGAKTQFSCSFKGSKAENRVEVGNIWRYAVTHLLKWTPEEAAANMTDEIVKRLHLDKTFSGVDFNPTVDYKSDYRFILQYAFPDEIVYDFKEQTLDDYMHVSHIGPYTNSTDKFKFPKKFFTDRAGFDRAAVILNYLVNTYLSDLSTEEQYAFFADSKKAKAWLGKKYLKLVMMTMYPSPLEFFHDAINKNKKDDLLYYAHIVKNKIEEMK